MERTDILLICCLLLISVLHISQGQDPFPLCGLLEREVECVDICNCCERDACERSQKDSFMACIPGCECLPGYVRDSSGRCIPRQQCKKNPTRTRVRARNSGLSGLGDLPGGGLPGLDGLGGLGGGLPGVGGLGGSGGGLPGVGGLGGSGGGLPGVGGLGGSGGGLLGGSGGGGTGGGLLGGSGGGGTGGGLLGSLLGLDGSGGCPRDFLCTRSCNRRNYRRGVCLGPGNEFCNCFSLISK